MHVTVGKPFLPYLLPILIGKEFQTRRGPPLGMVPLQRNARQRMSPGMACKQVKNAVAHCNGIMQESETMVETERIICGNSCKEIRQEITGVTSKDTRRVLLGHRENGIQQLVAPGFLRPDTSSKLADILFLHAIKGLEVKSNTRGNNGHSSGKWWEMFSLQGTMDLNRRRGLSNYGCGTITRMIKVGITV